MMMTNWRHVSDIYEMSSNNTPHWTIVKQAHTREKTCAHWRDLSMPRVTNKWPLNWPVTISYPSFVIYSFMSIAFLLYRSVFCSARGDLPRGIDSAPRALWLLLSDASMARDFLRHIFSFSLLFMLIVFFLYERKFSRCISLFVAIITLLRHDYDAVMIT